MADLDDKVGSTKTGFLDELLGGLHDAVVSAQRLVEKQHIDMVDLYFDDETGQPLTMDMKIPSAHPDKDFENLSVPLFTMAPLSSIKIKELEMKFKVKLSEQMDTVSELTKSMRHEDEPTTVGGVGIDMNSTNPDTMAEIKITFEGSDAPEGVMRINDQLVKTINGQNENTTTE